MKDFKFDKRFVAGLLAVIALLTSMFFDCVVLSREVKNSLRSVTGGLDYTRLVEDLVPDLSISSLESMTALDPTGSSTKLLRVARRITKCFKSGGVSLTEARTLLSQAARAAKLSYNSSSGLTAGLWFYTFFLLIIYGSFALAMSGVILRKKARGFWFASMLFLLLLIETTIVLVSEGALAITLWPFIGLGCSIASIVLCFQIAQPAYGYAPGGGSGINGAAIASGLANMVNAGKQMGQRVGRAAASAAASATAAAKAATSWTCPNCGRQVDVNGRFCPGCGTPRPEKRRCPTCGAEVRDDAAFCARCGSSLSGAQQNFHPNARQGFNQNPQQGFNPNPQQGFNQNPQQGFNPNPQQGFNPNPQQNFNPGYQQGFNQNPQQNFNPNFQQGFNQNPQQGFNPNPQQGFNPNPQQGFNPNPQARNPFDGINLDATIRDGDSPSGDAGSAKPSLPPMPVTVVVDHESAGVHREYSLNLGDSLTIGRSPACAIQLEDGTVSGTHLRVDREDGSLFATDLRSANGAKLNGAPLLSKSPLNSGDVLTLGQTQVTITY